MVSFLKNHPFAVDAFFENSIVLTFAFHKDKLAHLIPECLELDLFNNEWAFIAVALVKTKNLRPTGFPKFLGNNFILVGYRVFVRYTNDDGKSLRGLYILKSQTDKKKMEFFGNLFTHYSYTTTDIKYSQHDNQLEIKSIASDFKILMETGNDVVELPVNSPFSDWKEARRFAGPLPFTFTYDVTTKKILIIEGVRENWKPKPVKVIDYHISFLESLGLTHEILTSAFTIENIPYRWKKGKIDQWNR